jgi:hypothetical protein
MFTVLGLLLWKLLVGRTTITTCQASWYWNPSGL